VNNNLKFTTYDNFFDLTCSIRFGKNTQVAGKGSQFWTHGYMHANSGTERIRVDGEIIIGDNVYVGTKCVFNPGVKVSNAINIGGNSVISKDLNESGMYVNQSLRYLKKDAQEVRERLTRVSEKNLTEEIYTKNR
jgi:acetyltransferase-like isoleucine patch superfamily enzyme